MQLNMAVPPFSPVMSQQESVIIAFQYKKSTVSFLSPSFPIDFRSARPSNLTQQSDNHPTQHGSPTFFAGHVTAQESVVIMLRRKNPLCLLCLCLSQLISGPPDHPTQHGSPEAPPLPVMSWPQKLSSSCYFSLKICSCLLLSVFSLSIFGTT